MDEFLTIKTFTFPYEAEIVKGRLQSEGIECYLKDEMTVQIISLYSNAIGGIKLQVKQSDIPKAIEILKETGYLTDKDFQPPTYLQRFYNITSYIPFFKKLTIGNRVLTLAGIIIIITAIIYYFATLPTLQEKLINKVWCVDEIRYKGQKIQLNIPGPDSTDNCNENIYFSKDFGYASTDDEGYVNLPGVYASGDWKFNGNSITISKTNLDSLTYLYCGTYSVRFKSNIIILQSNTTTIYGHIK